MEGSVRVPWIVPQLSTLSRLEDRRRPTPRPPPIFLSERGFTMTGMPSRPLLAVLCMAAVLAGALGRSSDAAAPDGSGVVFSVFENLPPNGACPGLYAVDERTRKISWLGGWDAQRRDSALYPAFTANGTFSYGQIVDPSASPPFVEVYAGDRSVARAYAFTGWAWSPRREEVAFGGASSDGRRLELVLGSVSGSKRVLAASTNGGLSWLPDGTGLVYGRRAGQTDVITFVAPQRERTQGSRQERGRAARVSGRQAGGVPPTGVARFDPVRNLDRRDERRACSESPRSGSVGSAPPGSVVLES